VTWQDAPEPQFERLSGMERVRAGLRAIPLVALFALGAVVLLGLRLIERPLFGVYRPVTPYVSRAVFRTALVVLGIRFHRHGRPMAQPGGVVSNHASWLDIVAHNAAQPVYFVSKAEVGRWPVIGPLARAVGTVFIRRDPRDAAAQKQQFEARLKAGHRLLFFPEGTSSDGLQVLPFKSTLFAAFFSDDLRDISHIQPMSVHYTAPGGQEPQFYGWWGEMEFGPHLLRVLAARRQGRIDVMFHPALKVSDFEDRKALGQAAEQAVRAGHARLSAEVQSGS